MLKKISKPDKTILNSSVARYILVGGSTFVFEILVIYILKKIGINDILAVGIAFWFGLTASFVLQKILAFSNKDKGTAKLAKQAAYYGILVIVNYIFTLVLVASLTDSLGVFISRTIALIITTFWNFFVYKNIIFKNSRI